MKDICYDCEKVQDYGTMTDIKDDKFDIFCDDCLEERKKG